MSTLRSQPSNFQAHTWNLAETGHHAADIQIYACRRWEKPVSLLLSSVTACRAWAGNTLDWGSCLPPAGAQESLWRAPASIPQSGAASRPVSLEELPSLSTSLEGKGKAKMTLYQQRQAVRLHTTASLLTQGLLVLSRGSTACVSHYFLWLHVTKDKYKELRFTINGWWQNFIQKEQNSVAVIKMKTQPSVKSWVLQWLAEAALHVRMGLSHSLLQAPHEKTFNSYLHTSRLKT